MCGAIAAIPCAAGPDPDGVDSRRGATVILNKCKDASSGEITYRHGNTPPDPPPSPSDLGGRIDADQRLVVFADRVEMRWVWCHSSGQAELYFDGEPDVIARTAGVWPERLLSTITERFGQPVAAEVDQVLKDPSSFLP